MGVWQDKKRKEWIYTFKHLGKTYGGRARTKSEALAKRENHKAEIKKADHAKAKTGTTFSEICNTYLGWAERQVKILHNHVEYDPQRHVRIIKQAFYLALEFLKRVQGCCLRDWT